MPRRYMPQFEPEPGFVFSVFSTGKSFHMSYMTRKRIVDFRALESTPGPLQPRSRGKDEEARTRSRGRGGVGRESDAFAIGVHHACERNDRHLIKRRRTLMMIHRLSQDLII